MQFTAAPTGDLPPEIVDRLVQGRGDHKNVSNQETSIDTGQRMRGNNNDNPTESLVMTSTCKVSSSTETTVISCLCTEKYKRPSSVFNFFPNFSQYVFSSWGRWRHHCVIIGFSAKDFGLHSCGQCILRTCNSDSTHYVMGESYHCVTGRQHGDINHEQFKWRICLDSQEKKAEMDETITDDDVMAKLHWFCGYVSLIFTLRKPTLSVRV